MQHRRTTVASMFQNGISRNTKCDIMVGFPKSSHKYGEHLLDSFNSTNVTSLLASLIASLFKCSLRDPSRSGSNSSQVFFLGFKYFSNAMCTLQLRESIVGKLVWLPSQPRKSQKFSPVNVLPCTVI